MKCEICGNKTKGEVKSYKSEIFGNVCLCGHCVREYGGQKDAVEAFELGAVIFVNRK